MAAIFVASSQSVVEIPFGAPDYVAHATGYAVLGALLVRALAGGNLKTMAPALILPAVMIGTLYGASDEFHQWFVPGRHMSLSDLVADCVGTTVGATAATLLGRLLARQNPEP